MSNYQGFSAIIFSLLMLCLFIMFFTDSWGILFFLTALTPVLVVIQVIGVLRGKEEPLAEEKVGEWYEKR